ncbi:hypothetical protein F4678DRAFT_477920 [Xylaria arbuscula]|nr:hypothetical protein F4678DRAFT_477920 [Xylaria arbuscula]
MSDPTYVVMPVRADRSGAQQKDKEVATAIEASLQEKLHPTEREEHDGPLKKVIANSDSLYKYISWDDPVRTLASYLGLLGIMCGVHYLHWTQWFLKLGATGLGVVYIASFVSRSTKSNPVARMRPEYKQVPEPTLNATLKDIHDLVQYLAIQGQKVIYGEQPGKTLAAFFGLTALFWLMKIMSPFNLGILGLSSAYIVPLIASPGGREVAHSAKVHAQELAYTTSESTKGALHDTKAKATDLSGRAQYAAGNVTSRTQQTASNMSSGAQDMAANMSSGTKNVAGNMSSGAQDMAGNMSSGAKSIAENVSSKVQQTAGNSLLNKNAPSESLKNISEQHIVDIPSTTDTDRTADAQPQPSSDTNTGNHRAADRYAFQRHVSERAVLIGGIDTEPYLEPIFDNPDIIPGPDDPLGPGNLGQLTKGQIEALWQDSKTFARWTGREIMKGALFQVALDTIQEEFEKKPPSGVDVSGVLQVIGSVASVMKTVIAITTDWRRWGVMHFPDRAEYGALTVDDILLLRFEIWRTKLADLDTYLETTLAPQLAAVGRSDGTAELDIGKLRASTKVYVEMIATIATEINMKEALMMRSGLQSHMGDVQKAQSLFS